MIANSTILNRKDLIVIDSVFRRYYGMEFTSFSRIVEELLDLKFEGIDTVLDDYRTWMKIVVMLRSQEQ